MQVIEYLEAAMTAAMEGLSAGGHSKAAQGAASTTTKGSETVPKREGGERRQPGPTDEIVSVVSSVALFVATGVLGHLLHKWLMQRSHGDDKFDRSINTGVPRRVMRRLTAHEKFMLQACLWRQRREIYVVGHDEAVAEVTDALKAMAAIPRDDTDRDSASAKRAILLHGPPGTGKTSIAEVAAANASSYFLRADVALIRDQKYGESENRVRSLWSLARKLWYHDGAASVVIFVDEVDVLLGLDQNHDASRSATSLFQEYTSGLGSCPGVMLLAATNEVNRLSDAIFRRFQSKIKIDLPNADVRATIIRSKLLEAAQFWKTWAQRAKRAAQQPVPAPPSTSPPQPSTSSRRSSSSMPARRSQCGHAGAVLGTGGDQAADRGPGADAAGAGGGGQQPEQAHVVSADVYNSCPSELPSLSTQEMLGLETKLEECLNLKVNVAQQLAKPQSPLQRLAALTEGYSGAELRDVVSNALYDHFGSTRIDVAGPVQEMHLLKALAKTNAAANRRVGMAAAPRRSGFGHAAPSSRPSESRGPKVGGLLDLLDGGQSTRAIAEIVQQELKNGSCRDVVKAQVREVLGREVSREALRTIVRDEVLEGWVRGAAQDATSSQANSNIRKQDSSN